MIEIRLGGSFKNTMRFFDSIQSSMFKAKIRQIFHKYGQIGVETLRRATPKDTGETASSWGYDVTDTGITWINSKILANGVPLAILLQYGHGTRGGGYVRGIDYINPALRPIFDQISEECWMEVQNL
jgi:hypothetical protein